MYLIVLPFDNDLIIDSLRQEQRELILVFAFKALVDGQNQLAVFNLDVLFHEVAFVNLECVVVGNSPPS